MAEHVTCCQTYHVKHQLVCGDVYMAFGVARSSNPCLALSSNMQCMRFLKRSTLLNIECILLQCFPNSPIRPSFFLEGAI